MRCVSSSVDVVLPPFFFNLTKTKTKMIHIYKNKELFASFESLEASGAATRLQLLYIKGRELATSTGCVVTLIDSETRLTFESIYTALENGKVSSSRLYKLREDQCDELLAIAKQT